jgi:hypothetical protein
VDENFIKTVNVDILNGVFKGEMALQRGLNIVTGENGTLKSTLLQFIKSPPSESVVITQLGRPVRTVAVSPKRNAERKAYAAALQTFRQQGKTWESTENQLFAAPIRVDVVESTHSVTELFVLRFEEATKDGRDRIERMHALVNEFNGVLQTVFPSYSLKGEWQESLGTPKLSIENGRGASFTLEQLSTGEQDVMSLILNLSSLAAKTDTFLIDEPEVHLNWALEDKLFSFLNALCDERGKQAIVVTHSRTIFREPFLGKVQFLLWEDRRVVVKRTLTTEQKMRLAGDAIAVVQLGVADSSLAVFVEDATHEELIAALGEVFERPVTTTRCGNGANVRSLFEFARANGNLTEALFVHDGDNEGNPLPNEARYVHLPYYCFENVLLDVVTLATLTGKDICDIQNVICNALKRKQSMFTKSKHLNFLLELLLPEHITWERLGSLDASCFAKEVFASLDLAWSRDTHVAYFRTAHRSGRLADIVPKPLLCHFERPAPHGPGP